MLTLVMLRDCAKCELLNLGNLVCPLTGGANIQTTDANFVPMRPQDDGGN